MKILIACEESATVRDAFRAAGHDAWSCDIQPSRGDPRWHIQGDVLTLLGDYTGRHPVDCWDMMIAHPPCTHLAVSGSRWFAKKRREQIEAFEFFMRLALAPIPRIALEQPVSVVSSRWRRPDQVVQPWMFGHAENKATCLFLKNLPPWSRQRLSGGKSIAGRFGWRIACITWRPAWIAPASAPRPFQGSPPQWPRSGELPRPQSTLRRSPDRENERTAMPSDTPRTDDKARMPTDAHPSWVVDVAFARELERENTALRAERDKLMQEVLRLPERIADEVERRSAKCTYCGGKGTIAGPLLESYDCPVCRPTTTTAGAIPA